MRSLFIKISSITDVSKLAAAASNVFGDVTVSKGRYAVDCKSIMGLFSLDMSSGATVEYPEDAKEFEEFIMQFKG